MNINLRLDYVLIVNSTLIKHKPTAIIIHGDEVETLSDHSDPLLWQEAQ